MCRMSPTWQWGLGESWGGRPSIPLSAIYTWETVAGASQRRQLSTSVAVTHYSQVGSGRPGRDLLTSMSRPHLQREHQQPLRSFVGHKVHKCHGRDERNVSIGKDVTGPNAISRGPLGIHETDVGRINLDSISDSGVEDGPHATTTGRLFSNGCDQVGGVVGEWQDDASGTVDIETWAWNNHRKGERAGELKSMSEDAI